jgi:hypothetical protein
MLRYNFPQKEAKKEVKKVVKKKVPATKKSSK